MKMNMKIALAILALGTATGSLMAQDGKPGGGHRPPPPVIAALDANHDGIIDATEIANASAALKTLDKNGDGQLTQDELRPARPPGDQQGNGGQGERPAPPQEN